MKCLIIAAGKGSRLRFKGNSKPLIPILGVPIIERVIRSAMKAGVDSFHIVTGCNGEKVRSFLDSLANDLGVEIKDVINDDWEKGNGISVLKAKECLRDEKFLLLMADHMLDPSILRDLAESPIGEDEISLAVDFNTSNPLVDMDDVTRVNCSNGRVDEIGKGISEFNGFDTGIFLCTPAIFNALENIYNDNGDASLSDGIRNIAVKGKVNAFNIGKRFWLDVDDPNALKKAEDALINQIKGKPGDGPVSRYLNRHISVRLSRMMLDSSVTPNQISFFSFILSVVAAIFFTMQGYWALATGAVLAQAASVIDGCDGEVARLKYLESDYGGWFDAVLDRYADAFLLFGLTWHSYLSSGNHFDIFIGFMAIIGSFMLSYTADKYDGLMKARFEKGRGFRIGRDVRVFIIFIGALLNQAYLTLLIIAVLMNAETVRRVVVSR
ncbi:MAG: NTP transferase domain-containing protein, partial [Nitrospinota bacterium]